MQIQNPNRADALGTLRDPSILPVGDRYYMVASIPLLERLQRGDPPVVLGGSRYLPRRGTSGGIGEVFPR